MESAITFFSYSRTDSAFVLKLAKDLRNAGASVWLDQIDIVAGSHWDESVEAALNAASRLIVILSPASVESDNVMDEVSFALESGKTVIPILISECKIPFRLRRLQRVDLTGDYDTGFAHLLQVLKYSKGNNTEIEINEPGQADPLKKRSIGEENDAGSRNRGGSIKTHFKYKKQILAAAGLVLIILCVWAMKKFVGKDKPGDTVITADTLQNEMPSPPDTASVLLDSNTIDEIKTSISATDVIPLPENERVSFDSNTWYRLTTSWLGEGRSMEVKGQNNFYAPVELNATADTPAQAWKIIGLENGYFKLVNQEWGTGYNLALVTVDDHLVTKLGTADDIEQQLWKITRIQDGPYYKLTSFWKGDKLALDVRNDGQNNILHLYPVIDTLVGGEKKELLYSGQHWIIKPF